MRYLRHRYLDVAHEDANRLVQHPHRQVRVAPPLGGPTRQAAMRASLLPVRLQRVVRQLHRQLAGTVLLCLALLVSPP